MLQAAYIKENREIVLQKLQKKNFQNTHLIDEVIEADTKRKKLQAELDDNLSKANQLAAKIGDLFKSGKADEASNLKQESTKLKELAKPIQEALHMAEEQLHAVLVQLPNLPNDLVKAGKSAQDNENIHEEGNVPVFSFKALPHWELAAKYDIIDFELGVKISGAGFPVYKGQGARLQRALINFFLDRATAAGYKEIQPPHLVNQDSGFGTGQLPDKEGQMYHVGLDDLYLIPTAEVPVTNLYRDVILNEDHLPVKNTAYTPCFRREAGSYGKDVRGLNRLHQFDKVEIVQVAKPSDSYAILEEMKNYVAGLIRELGLPFRILRLCGGDMSFASAMTYDMEVFSAAQEKWLEVSSVSNFESFQANRLKLRYRDSEKKIQLAHTLNGSALALPRILAALLENNQSAEGIKMPACLVPYTGFEWIK